MDNRSPLHHSSVRFLHAALVISILLQFALFYFSEWFGVLKPYKGTLFMLHKSTGNLTVLIVLALIWSGWRYGRPNHHLPCIQTMAAGLVKTLLLLSALAMSVSGYVMTSVGGYAYRFYGLFNVPLMIVGPNEYLGKLAHTVHGVAATVLLVLFVMHTLAALFHRFVKKDGVFQSML